MGIMGEPGEVIKRKCYSCREEVQVVATGADICFCPYCGYSLMEPCPNSIPAAMERLDEALASYRAGEITKSTLRYALSHLDDALQFSRFCTLVTDDVFRLVRQVDDDLNTKVFSFRGELFVIGRHVLYRSKYEAVCTDGRKGWPASHASIKAAKEYMRAHFNSMV
jgi:hypothetical protein